MAYRKTRRSRETLAKMQAGRARTRMECPAPDYPPALPELRRRIVITDSRYPYTYAADYLREKVGNDYDNGLMSRSAASQARSVIAEVLGLEDADVAQKLADAFIAAHRA